MKTLRGKFLLIVLPPVIACFLIFSVLFSLLTYLDTKRSVLNKLKSTAKVQAFILAKSLWDVNLYLAEVQVKTITLDPAISAAQLVEFTTNRHIEAGNVPADDLKSRYFELHQDIVYEAPNKKHFLGRLSLYSEKRQIFIPILRSFAIDTLLLLFLISASLFVAVHRAIFRLDKKLLYFTALSQPS